MKRKGIITCLTQGAIGTMIVTYLFFLGLVIYSGDRQAGYVLPFVLLMYVLFTSFIGVPMGGIIWLIGALGKRGPGLLIRGTIGAGLPVVIFTSLAVLFAGKIEWPTVAWGVGICVSFTLPSALLAGSRFDPIRTIALGRSRVPLACDLGTLVSLPFGFLLRAASLLGWLGTVLYLAAVTSSEALDKFDWSIDRDPIFQGVVVLLYFSVIMFLSFAEPRKSILLTTALLANAPLVIFVFKSNAIVEVLSRTAWLFIALSTVFVVGRMIIPSGERGRLRRVIPVTMLEVQLRYTFNRL